MKVLILLITLLLSSCGDSPFVDDEATKNESFIQSQESSIKFTKLNLEIDFFWREGPQIGDESKFLVLTKNSNGKPISVPGDLKIKLWMPDMGHGSYPVTIKNISEGVYDASEIFFTMGGYWDLHFQIYKNDQLIEEVLWGITL